MPDSQIGVHPRHCELPKMPMLVDRSSRLADALANQDRHGLEAKVVGILLEQASQDFDKRFAAQFGGTIVEEVLEVN